MFEEWKKYYGDFTVEEEIQQERIEICKGCDKFHSFTTQCSECSCVMNLKTWIKGANCPIGKW